MSVETLIRDSVAVVYQRTRKGEASVHLNRNWYSSTAAPSSLTHSIHIGRAYNAMIEMGYLKQTKKGVYDRRGRKDGSRQNSLTRYRATDRLIEKFTPAEQEVFSVIVPPRPLHASIRIQTKGDDNRKELSFPARTDEVRRMEANLHRINRVLSSRWYDLEISDEELTQLQVEMSANPEGPKSLAMDRRQLYRVFNDTGLETGGRFYGGWWQNIPKRYRRYLIVNAKRMIEIDYSNMHPAILYANVGSAAPADCYTGIFDKATERLGGDDLRETIKAAFNAMLNAKKALYQAPKGVTPKRFGMTWREVSDRVMAAHEPISQYFYSGIGSRLQRQDSDIAERVMLDFIERNIPILPIHDSFLVHEGHRTFLNERMEVALKETCGIQAKLKAVEPDMTQALDSLKEQQENDPDGFGSETTQDIHELLEARSGYDRRLDAFYRILNGKRHP